jgi:receptor protein-tyrosine kinase
MSLIERAMNKLSGAPDEEEPKPEAPRADAAVSAELDTASSAPVDTPAAENTGAAQPSVARDESEPPASVRLDEQRDPAPQAPDQAGSRPDHHPAPPPGGNSVVVDLERLAAGGFLTPSPHSNRQTEEYQRIKRRLLANIAEGAMPSDKPVNLIMITSSVPGEGKTFSSVNLAVSMAMEVDHTVLVVDTDIIKSDLSNTFGVADRKGLYDLLAADSADVKDVLVRTSIPNLVVLPAGQDRKASTERLASAAMRTLMGEISKRYSDRVVIFDSPPILATTTATALAPLVGQLVLVVEAARTKQETVKASLQALDNVQVTGLILNKSKQPAASGYYYYGYGYYQQPG